jgi:L-ascorbate metabolism protein UlaG (beta-lactamase superfamily)
MRHVSLVELMRWAKKAAITTAAVLIVATSGLAWLWHDRASLDEIDWTPYPAIEPSIDAVTMTWLGVTTLLFDDGETQLLVDGFFSRPSLPDVLLGRPVTSDAATINYVLDEYRMRRLAAIIPTQSHYDHAMDVGAIANRGSATVVGSASTANIARGAGVPEDQILVAAAGEPYTFGLFTVTLFEMPHAPIGWGGSVPVDGTIDKPLEQPAPVWAYRVGEVYSILIEHPHGTTLVHSSGGFSDGALTGVHADIVMLGIGLVEGLGRDYTEKYWQATVTTTGAAHVFPFHFDDYTQPFGEIVPYPRVLDNLITMSRWLEEIRNTWDSDARLHLPEFGKTLILYPQASPEA